VAPERVAAIRSEGRRSVLASGCGAVATILADPATFAAAPARGPTPEAGVLRSLFKQLFQRGERYRDTGGIHAAALTDATSLIAHAEDIGRHNAVDKVIGGALLGRRAPAGLGLLVTGRISAELASKAARAGLVWIATPSVPSTLAVDIARRTGMTLIGRAVSGTPRLHRAGG
jgi:FdhD protein